MAVCGPIKTRRDYSCALREIEGLMDAKRDTPDGERLHALVTLVEAWEARAFGPSSQIKKRLTAKARRKGRG
jgi:antitoxin component HigA of HigAB toxin-antitoxin module